MKNISNLKCKGGGLKLDTVCIAVGVMMLDVVVYLLLELLLLDYDENHGLLSSHNSDKSLKYYDHLVTISLYFWHGINLVLMLLLVYRSFKEGGERLSLRKSKSRF